MCVCALMLLAVLLAALPALAGPLLVVGPSFALQQQRSLVTRAGEHAALRCRVLRLADRSVSWVRSSDLQILSHAGAVFTADSRVSCSEAPYRLEVQDPDNSSGEFSLYGAGILTSRDDVFSTAGTEHTLRIERLRISDSGRYECQINTEPKLSLFYNLTVVESSLPTVAVRAVGTSAGGVVWGEEGGAARFECEARYEPAEGAALDADVLAALPPLRLTWLHEGEPMDPRSSRGGISLDTERWAGRVVSRLTLARAARGDAGRYTCGVGEGEGHSADVLLRLRGDRRDHGLDQGEPEWMQRDQAVARVSGARGAAGGRRGAGGAGGGGGCGAGGAGGGAAAAGPHVTSAPTCVNFVHSYL